MPLESSPKARRRSGSFCVRTSKRTRSSSCRKLLSERSAAWAVKHASLTPFRVASAYSMLGSGCASPGNCRPRMSPRSSHTVTRILMATACIWVSLGKRRTAPDSVSSRRPQKRWPGRPWLHRLPSHSRERSMMSCRSLTHPLQTAPAVAGQATAESRASTSQRQPCSQLRPRGTCGGGPPPSSARAPGVPSSRTSGSIAGTCSASGSVPEAPPPGPACGGCRSARAGRFARPWRFALEAKACCTPLKRTW
mmetsp:Transcript_105707/g.299277  ORF Transcript_105707/g.299277 Transcript_105707/m.299277 type:complete len:251 (-) Transcript_105707:432-1184(-)